MKTVVLEDQEWQWLISTVATHFITNHPTMNKLSRQLAQQQGNGNAAEGLSERPDPGALSPRVEAAVPPPDRSDSPQQRPSRPAKR